MELTYFIYYAISVHFTLYFQWNRIKALTKLQKHTFPRNYYIIVSTMLLVITMRILNHKFLDMVFVTKKFNKPHTQCIRDFT